MKICYISFDSIGSVFTPLLLDDALEKAQSPENAVTFIYCDSALSSCGINYFESKFLCSECVVNSKLLLHRYKKDSAINFIPLSSVTEKSSASAKNIVKYQSLDELKDVTYKGIYIGLGAVSSYVSKTRNISPNFSDPFVNQFFNKFLSSAKQVVDAVLRLNRNFDFDEYVICNGRLINERAVYETVNLIDKHLSVLELVSSKEPGRFRKFNYGKFLPHDILNSTNLIEEYWKINSVNSKVAEIFFRRRRNGEYASDTVYTGLQKFGLLPKSWDTSKRNIVIFNSSEDEVYSIGGLWDEGKLFHSQKDGVEFILNAVKNIKDIHIYLRIHPNLKNVKYNYVQDLFKFEEYYDNFHIIPANSTVSTYSLVDKAEKVIVFGSSIGVEANFWRKPVISLSPSSYHYLNVSYFPKSFKDLDFLLKSDLEPKPLVGSLKWGLYTFGEKGSEFQKVDFNLRIFKLFGKKIAWNNYLTFGMIICKTLFRTIRLIFDLIDYFKFKKLLKEG